MTQAIFFLRYSLLQEDAFFQGKHQDDLREDPRCSDSDQGTELIT